MTLQELNSQFLTAERRKAVRAGLVAACGGQKGVVWSGLAGSSVSALLASIPEKLLGQTALIAASDLDDAGYIYQDLVRLLGEEAVSIFPSGYRRDIKYGRVDPPQQILRTDTLARWGSDARLRFVVSYPEAMAERVATKEQLQAATLTLAVGQEIDLEKMQQWLRDNGFAEVDYVYEPGHFAVRGSIVDIFGYASELPVRLDLFGDEIESLRTFNVETQLSDQRLQQTAITANLVNSEQCIVNSGAAGNRVVEESVGAPLDIKHSSLIIKNNTSILDFAPEGTVVFCRNFEYLRSRVAAVCGETFSASAAHAGDGDAQALQQLIDPAAFAQRLDRLPQITVASGEKENREERIENRGGAPTSTAQDSAETATVPSDTNRRQALRTKHLTLNRAEGPTTTAIDAEVPAAVLSDTTGGQALNTKHLTLNTDFGCSPQGLYHKNFDLLSAALHKLLAQDYTLYILSDSPKQIERLRAIFAERQADADLQFTAVEATLHEGFVDHDTRRAIFTDHQIFDRFHKYTLRSERARSGRVALSLKELGAIEVGDYIVHVDHGVGKFGGLLRTQVNGTTQEMVKLIYQNNDCIFVSIHALHKLAKYRGKEGVPPQINKLGSGAWNRLKERTKEKLKDIARDLIRLYAQRRDEKGFQFSPDSYMQHELEASFTYEDTPDQQAASVAVKKDMESPRPMDRLVCGDVGFGKTEVAIRASFKAATDGKQVAVLVPTTVLAYQHFNTFRERLADMPVRVEYLSRARSPKQAKEILADLAAGKIDILIGTHRIVGKDVKFKDLGLLVIDEEQKFGVAVKEKLKQLKVNVDTLTMSATPIPRTLQFSLMGARDLSNINTPPPNRYPILTSVDTLTDELLAEAIGFEMARNGQVFIINNRIEGLYQLQEQVRRVIPDARTLVAHGQMPPDQLEKAVIDFANHDYDVLLATTIIESGIDMPNVNTIIVNNAQNFGLSELHQLRGRVGRSSRKAFCYLMVPPGVPLTPVAQRRLQAIESFSDLGSGIHIAMQDLDIRGAGNLLGAEQSGFIADLGYETYQKILREAVTELRTGEFAATFASERRAKEEEGSADGADEFVTDCTIESDLELLLPASYVPSESERIDLYRRLDATERQEELDTFRANLIDRFGAIPHPTEELMLVPPLRWTARRLGIEKVSLKQGKMFLYFVGEENAAYYQSAMFGRLVSLLQLYPERVAIRQGARRSFAVSSVPTVAEALALLRSVLTLPPA